MVSRDAWGELHAAKGARALFRDVSAWDVERVTTRLDDLDEGFHVVVLTFEGELFAARMRNVLWHVERPWRGAEAVSARPAEPMGSSSSSWVSSMDRQAYEAGVRRIRHHIAAGDVYQVNLCRTLTTREPIDLDALFLGILQHNPARHAARIDVAGLPAIVSASPETYLVRKGRSIRSAPIKGTAVTAEQMLAKDVTENVMITDLVRNDLQRVCEPGTVAVEGLLSTEQHPGLVHLVSTVVGELCSGVRWRDIVGPTSPPGSVSGTPKIRALEVIESLEAAPRGPYCGAIGWIDADSASADLAVGIRTFWSPTPGTEGVVAEPPAGGLRSNAVHFGVGAGITWDSEPRAEWDETELKARRLLSVAAGAVRREQA